MTPTHLYLTKSDDFSQITKLKRSERIVNSFTWKKTYVRLVGQLLLDMKCMMSVCRLDKASVITPTAAWFTALNISGAS